MRTRNNLRVGTSKPLTREEVGQMTLFAVAIILPMLFFLGALTVDFWSYVKLKESVQQQLDQAALYAYKFLPYNEEAEKAAALATSWSPLLKDRITTTVASGQVTLSAKLSIPLFFFSYFGMAPLEVPLFSSAVGTPFDALVILDLGKQTRPEYSEVAWGDELLWPASQYVPLKDGVAAVNPRVATQQCFNPVASVLKRAAIRSYYYLAASAQNAVGVGIAPGYGTDVDLLRFVLPGESRSFAGSQQVGEMDYPAYAGIYSNTNRCAALSEREFAHQPDPHSSNTYRFPTVAAEISRLWSAPANPPLSMLMPGGSFDPQYAAYLSVLQGIWMRPGHDSQNANFEAILDTIRNELVVSPAIARRGALQGKVSKLAIVISSNLPQAPGGQIFPSLAAKTAFTAKIIAIAADLEKINPLESERPTLSLLYVVVRPPPLVQVDAAQVSELVDFFNSLENNGLKVFIAAVNSEAEMFRDVLGPALMRSKRAVVNRSGYVR